MECLLAEEAEEAEERCFHVLGVDEAWQRSFICLPHSARDAINGRFHTQEGHQLSDKVSCVCWKEPRVMTTSERLISSWCWKKKKWGMEKSIECQSKHPEVFLMVLFRLTKIRTFLTNPPNFIHSFVHPVRVLEIFLYSYFLIHVLCVYMLVLTYRHTNTDTNTQTQTNTFTHTPGCRKYSIWSSPACW